VSHPGQTVQNEMWNRLRKTHCPVSIYLCNGVKLSRVVITSFDMYAVTIRTAGETHLVCKSSIATVLPEPRKEIYQAPAIRHQRTPAPTTPNNIPVVTVKRRPIKFMRDEN